jgi:hypothetical protein
MSQDARYTKTRIAFGIFAAVWVVVIALGILLWSLRPQRVYLPDGTKLTLAAVTYGKHHEFPGLKTTRFNTATDTVCVWIREAFTNESPGDYTIYVLDKSGNFCAGDETVDRYPAGKGTDVACLQLNAFPRRDGKLRLRIEMDNSQGEAQVMKDEMVVSYPAQNSSAKWQPQPLPATQEGDGLTVTLTKLVYGVSFNQPRNPVTTDPTDKAVLASFRVEQNGVIASNWQPVRIESWDATGNHAVSSARKNRRDGDEQVMIYQWGLSPEEPAWKLRAEFLRTSGFAEDELWTVPGIPVVTNADTQLRDTPTNAFAQTKLGNRTLVMYPARRQANGQISLHLSVYPPPPAPENLSFRLLEATDENGQRLKPGGRSWGGRQFRFNFRASDARTITATFALQGSHVVEFTVKPEKQ